MEFVGRVFKHRNKLALKFVELAEKYPNDPIAVDALIQAVWQVNTTPWPVELVGQDEARTKAFALLQRNHIQSAKLGALCGRISFGFCQEYELFLRAVLEQSPHREIRAQACLALAQFLHNRLQRLDLVKGDRQLAKEFEDLVGKAYLEQLLKQDRGKAASEAESLFEQATQRYGDVKLIDDGTIGERAEAGLYTN